MHSDEAPAEALLCAAAEREVLPSETSDIPQIFLCVIDDQVRILSGFHPFLINVTQWRLLWLFVVPLPSA